MKFTLNRNYVLATTLGSVEFKKGEATHVPPALYAEAQSAGATPESDIPEKEEAKKTNEPVDPAARKEALFDVFSKIALRNKREDFTAGGAPHGTVLAAELGWTVQAKERDIVWAEFKAGGDEK